MTTHPAPFSLVNDTNVFFLEAGDQVYFYLPTERWRTIAEIVPTAHPSDVTVLFEDGETYTFSAHREVTVR